MLTRPSLSLSVLAFFFLVPTTSADITVAAEDYAQGTFSYILPTTDHTAFTAAHTAATSEGRDVFFGPPAWFPTYAYYFDRFSPRFTYHFDFRNAGDTVTTVTIRDRLTHFGDGGNNLVESTISISTDGTNFTPVRSLQSPINGAADSLKTYVLSVEDATQFFYRVEMRAIPGDFNGQLNSALDQWGRSSQNNPSNFSIAFSNATPPRIESVALPTPSTISIVLADANGIHPATTPELATLLRSGGDSTFDDGNETDVLGEATPSWDAENSTLTLTFADPLADDLYQIALNRTSFNNLHGQVLPTGDHLVSAATANFSPPNISQIAFDEVALPTSGRAAGILSAEASAEHTLSSATFSYTQDGLPFNAIGTDDDPSDGLSAPWDPSLLPPGTYQIQVAVADQSGQLSRLGGNFTVSSSTPNNHPFNCLPHQQFASNPTHGSGFGNAVSVHGSTAVVGTAASNFPVYLFQHNGESWSETKKLLGTDTASTDGFGTALAVHGDLVAVGAPRDDSPQGTVYIFERNTGGENNWGQLKKITHPARPNGRSMGEALALFGDLLAVSDDSEGGQILLFKRNLGGADNWGFLQALRSSDPDSFMQYRALALRGDFLIAGAPFDNGELGSQEGTAFVFQRDAGGPGQWGEITRLTPDDPAIAKWFGAAVAIHGSTIAVGAPRDDSEDLRDHGSAYLFERDLGGANNWGQAHKLEFPAGKAANHQFGSALALVGDLLAVGSDRVEPGALALYGRNQGGDEQWGALFHLRQSLLECHSLSLSEDHLIFGSTRARAPGVAGTHGAVHFLDKVPTPPTIASLGFGSNTEIRVPVQDDCPVPSNQTPVATSILASGGDGTFTDGNETELLPTLTDSSFDADTSEVVFTLDTDLTNDTYQVTLRPDSVVDLAGTPLAADTNTITGIFNGPVVAGITLGGAPLPETLLLNGTLAVSATAENTLASATFLLNGEVFATDDDASNGLGIFWEIAELDRGQYTLEIIVRDQQGFATKVSRTITLDPFFITRFEAAEGGSRHYFGTNVALHGDLLVVGSPQQEVNGQRRAGSVFLYRRDALTREWTLLHTLSPEIANAEFGHAVAIEDDILAVGAIDETAEGQQAAGKVHLYQRNLGGPDNWGELTSFTGSGIRRFEDFGSTLALHQGLLAVGAERAQVGGISNVGVVYLFDRDEGGVNNWGEIRRLQAADPVANSRFGRALAISGDRIAVGCPDLAVDGQSRKGAVYLFERNAGGDNNWGQAGKISPADGLRNDYFGRALALDRDLLIVGSNEHDLAPSFNQGAVYFFERNQGGDNNWGQAHKIDSPLLNVALRFGGSLALDEDTLAVSASQGSRFDSSPSYRQGRVYLFDRHNNWALTNQLVSPEPTAQDGFGMGLALQGKLLLAGAPGALVGFNFSQGLLFTFDRTPPDIPQTPPSLGPVAFESWHTILVPLEDETPLPAILTPVVSSVLASGDDGTFQDGNETDLTETITPTWDADANTIRLTSTSPLTNDRYRIEFVADSVVDSDGTPLPEDGTEALGTQVLLTSFTLSLDSESVLEGGPLTGTITLAEEWFTDFPIALGSNRAADLDTGPLVTISAGERSAPFTIRSLDNDRLDAPRDISLFGTAPSSSVGETSFTIVDNDWPTLTLTLSRSNIAETDGTHAVVATLTREPVLPERLSVTLQNSAPDAVSIPFRANFAPGAATTTFVIGAIDNGTVDGPRTAEISGIAEALGTTVGMSNTATLDIGDDEGPTLALALETPALVEGIEATLVLRNLGGAVGADTLVTLSVSDPEEVTVPDNATIPAGSDLVRIPLTVPIERDGRQAVTLMAATAGFGTAEISVLVLDQALSDLVVTQAHAPTQVLTDESFEVTLQVANSGMAPLIGASSQRIVLSADQILDVDDLPVGQVDHSKGLEPGGTVELQTNAIAPSQAGTYYLLVVADALQTTHEIFEDNNTFTVATPLLITAAYTATVAAAESAYPTGEVIQLTGRAIRPDDAPAEFSPVEIHLRKSGTTRIVSALTDGNGRFAISWRPLPGEGGTFTIGAGHPGDGPPPDQDSFTILSINSTGFPGTPLVFNEGSAEEVRGQLSNPTGIDLTELELEVIGAPTGLDLSHNLPETLPAQSDLELTVTLTAAPGFFQSGTVILRITSAEGVTVDIPVSVRVNELRPRLVTEPESLACSVLRGSQKTPEFTLRNDGGAPTGPIHVSLPPVPWIKLATSSPLPSLAPGESATLSLTLTPALDVPLDLTTGTIAINPRDGDGIGLPFSFRTVSDLKGDLKIVAENELTYFTAEAPKLAGATVEVRDAITSEPIARQTTPENGTVTFTNLNEGWYTVDVTAPEHTIWRANVFVDAGEVTCKETFLSKNFVTYSWTVEEVEIQERYRISVETTFETDVPAPVITISPSTIDVEGLETLGDSKVLDLTIENQGIIAGEQTLLQFTEHPFYKIEPLVPDIGQIPAKSKVVVPVRVTRTGVFAEDGSIQSLPVAGPGGERPPQRAQPPAGEKAQVPCGMGGRAVWSYWCGTYLIEKGAPVSVSGVQGNCKQRSNPSNVRNVLSGISQGDRSGSRQGSSGGSSGGGGSFGGSPVDTGARVNRGGGGFNDNGTPRSTISSDFAGGYNVKSTTNCDCPFGFNEACAGGEVTIALPFIVKELTETLTGAFPGFTVSNPSISFTAGGKVCVCCKDGEFGASGELATKGTVKVTLEIGTPKIDAPQLTVLGWTLERLVFDASPKIEIDLLGSISIQGKRECGGGIKTCVAIDLGMKPFAGLKAEAGGVATNNIDKLRYTYKIEGKLGIEGFVGFKGEYCNDGKGTASIAASVDLIASLEGFAQRAHVDDMGENGLNTIWKPLALGGKINILTYPFKLPDNPPGPGQAPARGQAPQDPDDIFADSPILPFDLSEAILTNEELLATPELSAFLPSGSGNVCATVRMRVDQERVMTRSAFRATLGLTNNLPTGPLTAVGFDLDIRDDGLNPANDRFNIEVSNLQNIDTIDGTGTVDPNATANIQWTLIPRDTAAPEEDATYTIGGTISYTQGGKEFTIPVAAAVITVRPDACLSIRYFHQRDVYADAPNTPITEPSLPFFLGVQVCNTGAGAAHDLALSSAQPEIVDNEKGLRIDFRIDGTSIDGAAATPSLTANFGTIDPKSKRLAVWEMSSNVQGLFTEYSATFEHLDGLGDPRISLLKDVQIHEMIRLVNALGAKDDGLPDFLTNDIVDPDDRPDTIYLSDGSSAPVAVVETAEVTGAGLSYTITTPPTTGWTYLRLPDPSGGQVLTSVERSDGLVIPVNGNTWTTDRTFVGLREAPVYENIFHLVDCESTGQYTLHFTEPPAADTTAPESEVEMLDPDSASEIAVTWTGTDDTGIATYDVFVSIDGGPFELWLEGTRERSAVYQGEAGRSYAFYSVATDPAGNEEADPALGDTSTVVTVTNEPPVLSAIAPQSLREGESFSFVAEADDPDGPNSSLRYAVEADVPGLAIDETTGEMQWITGETDGGRTVNATLTVTDSGTPSESAQVQFSITVQDHNQAPSLEPIPHQTLAAGSLLFLEIEARDADLPAQALEFRLGAGAPAGMRIDGEEGLLTWSPDSRFAGTTQLVEVFVQDDGNPAAESALQIIVSVTPPDDSLPQIDELPMVVWLKGQSFSTVINAFDPDGDLITLSADTSEATGANFERLLENGRGRLTWDPSAADAGSYAIPITAEANGAEVQATLLVEVRDNNLYWSWATSTFGISHDDPDSLAALEANADPDGDDRTNVHEMTFLTDPTRKDQVPIEIALNRLGNVSIATVRVRRRVGSHAFTRLRPQRSSDLESWNPVPLRDFAALVDVAGDDDNNPLTETVNILIFNANGILNSGYYRIESALEP